MTELEREIHTTLLELDRVVASMPNAQPKPDLLAFFTKVDELARRLPPGTDPMLVHYLQRKSYQKARDFLQQQ